MMIWDGEQYREPLAAESVAGRARLQRFAERLYLDEIEARESVARRKAAGDPLVRDSKLEPLPSFDEVRARAIRTQMENERREKQLNPHRV